MNLRHSASPLGFAFFSASRLPPRALKSPTSIRNTARALGQEGHDALDRSDFATAADRFARADALVHAPTFVLGLAQAQVGLGKLVSADGDVQPHPARGASRRARPPPSRRPRGPRARKSKRSPRRIPYIILHGGRPRRGLGEGDHRRPARGPRRRARREARGVDPGKHEIRAEAPRLAPGEVSLTIAPGKTETVTLEPKPATAAPAPPPPPPVRRLSPPPLVVAPPPAPPPAVEAAPPAALSPGSTRRVLGIAGIAVGGAGIAVGAVMGGLAISKHGSLAKSCPQGPCARRPTRPR